MEMKVIGVIRTEFAEKFGVPRQSGLVPQLEGEIVPAAEYADAAAFEGIEEYSHLWLLWGFSENHGDKAAKTVRPPRLGGNVKKGVFATRSPYRPNAIGLSCVTLNRVIRKEDGSIRLIVGGADLMDGTPIYDIKPYLPYADAHPEARGGFGQEHSEDKIEVDFPETLLHKLPKEKRAAAVGVLSQDPRAAYQKREGSVYGLCFAGYDIRFTVKENRLAVCSVVQAADGTEKIK